MGTNYPETGYMKGDFCLFDLREVTEQDFSFHYHAFHKVLIFLGGNVGYGVEGRSYELRPRDIILVRAGEIHRPIPHDRNPYERIILYLSPDFLAPAAQQGYDLTPVFDAAASTGSNLVSLPRPDIPVLETFAGQMKAALNAAAYAAPLFQRTLVLSFLIWLNRLQKDGSLHYQSPAASNPLILQLLDYLNANITAAVSIDTLADRCHVSRSHLMHLFKAETGFSILRYITEKRLFLARQHIKSGMSATQACFSCGFTDYSCFYKAFRAKFGVSPKDAAKLP